MDQPSSAALQALLQQARQNRVHGEETGGWQELDGQRCVIKWAQTKPWARARSWLAALVCGVALGEWLRPARLRTGGVHTEAERLRALLACARRVPPVLLHADDAMILGWVGDSLDQIVPGLEPQERLTLFARVLDDLADWHAHGLWHGGAQLRNVTLHQGEMYRIDFEERHGFALPPAATCAYDVLLCLGDVLSLLPAAEVMAQGRVLLQGYLDRLAAAERPGVEQRLQRLARVLQPLVWVDRVWPRATRRRDKQRVVRFARVARAVLGGALAAD